MLQRFSHLHDKFHSSKTTHWSRDLVIDSQGPSCGYCVNCSCSHRGGEVVVNSLTRPQISSFVHSQLDMLFFQTLQTHIYQRKLPLTVLHWACEATRSLKTAADRDIHDLNQTKLHYSDSRRLTSLSPWTNITWWCLISGKILYSMKNNKKENIHREI